MVLQPLKDIGRPLMNVSLSTWIELCSFPTKNRVMGDKSIVSRDYVETKMSLGREYAY